MSRMARERSVEDLNKTWTFNTIVDHNTIDLNFDKGLREEEEDMMDREDQEKDAQEEEAMEKELNEMKALYDTTARLEKREKNREQEWDTREWDLDLSLNSDVEEEAEFQKELDDFKRDNMTLRRVKVQERAKERAASRCKDGGRCKGHPAMIDLRATVDKMKDLRRKRKERPATWTRRVEKARKPARWPCGNRYCGDRNCGNFNTEMKTEGETKEKEEEKEEKNEEEEKKEETEDDKSQRHGSGSKLGEEAGKRGKRWAGGPEGERAARAKLRELAARRLQKLKARSKRSNREKREAKMAEKNKEKRGEKEKEEKDEEEWDDEDEEEAKALKKSLDEEQELKKEVARLKEEAKAFERQAARDRKKIKEQKDTFRSLTKKAKAMGMRVEEFEWDEEEMMRYAEKKGAEERTYINRRNQELGSRAGPGPGPGPVQCRAMQRAATAAN